MAEADPARSPGAAVPAPGPGTTRRTALLAALALLALTACWGSTFFLIKDLLERVPTVDFLAVRFLVAGAAMLLVAPRAIARLSPETRRRALALGGLYGAAQVLQTAGLAHTPASVSGFITGLYVVATPVLAALLLRSRVTRGTWAAVALATVGLAVLSLDGLSVGYGEALTLVAALLYAAHIVGLGAWSRPADALGMSVLQVLVIAGICLVAALGTGKPGVVLPSGGADWASVLYMAIAAGALAMLAQTWAQAHLPPTRSAIIMSMEPVFAAFFAVLLGGESLTSRMLLGGALVLVAMLVVEALPRRHVEGEVPHIAV
ncbi:DMT family transporter [Nocardioides sp. zg-536]|uniref:DMT family transporter n=1 Tax=Nocardioides faecalis TaxID=2803858 RepID=A0A939BU60_9ACTN|nr:DMT family transporter [Nocardioides faecalis]MBM9461334.1 DMT family transporter [Nocardioides faecalis]QVI57605.1 DMT family transporter [Nocardioides faecalis]